MPKPPRCSFARQPWGLSVWDRLYDYDPAKSDGALLSKLDVTVTHKTSMLPPQKEKKPGRYCHCRLATFVLSSICEYRGAAIANSAPVVRGGPQGSPIRRKDPSVSVVVHSEIVVPGGTIDAQNVGKIMFVHRTNRSDYPPNRVQSPSCPSFHKTFPEPWSVA